MVQVDYNSLQVPPKEVASSGDASRLLKYLRCFVTAKETGELVLDKYPPSPKLIVVVGF